MLKLIGIALAACFVNSLLPTSSHAQAIRLGEEFKGEITKKGFFPGVGALDGYIAEVPVALKSGQKLSISVYVAGEDRRVQVGLVDPDGKLVKGGRFLDKETQQLDIKSVPSTGKYKIVVASTHAGAFTLIAKDPGAVRDIKTIERELAEARRRVEELERELNAARRPLEKGIPERKKNG
jgi:hypothetical protein